MLLYNADDDRNDAAVNYINEALKKGQLAVYASVNAKDAVHMDKICSKITDYDGHIEQGDLMVVRLGSFYERALIGNLEPFEDLKAILEGILIERINVGKIPEAIVVADCADMLSRNEKFDECIFVERWWHNTHSEWVDKNVRINVVCPHPSTVLRQEPFLVQEHQIARLHSLTVAAISK